MAIPEPGAYLHQLSQQLDTVHFLEIGAMDGKSFDLLHDFIHHYHWQGLLVEPLPDLFRELQRTYANCDGLKFDNVAVTNENEVRPIFRVPQEVIARERLPKWVKGISSLYDDRNAIGGKNGLLHGSLLPEKMYNRIKDHVVTESVACLSMRELLDKHEIQRIDVLQIDTEGFDYQVFKQFDFTCYHPYFVKVEVGNLIPEEHQLIQSILTRNNYQFVGVGLDILAYAELPG